MMLSTFHHSLLSRSLQSSKLPHNLFFAILSPPGVATLPHTWALLYYFPVVSAQGLTSFVLSACRSKPRLVILGTYIAGLLQSLDELASRQMLSGSQPEKVCTCRINTATDTFHQQSCLNGNYNKFGGVGKFEDFGTPRRCKQGFA